MCYIKYGDYMMQTKLYRNLYELIHPSISRKNITEYSIVLSDNILPIKVFYPKIGVELNRVILYLPDKKQNNEFYKKMAEELNSVIFLLETEDNDILCIKTIEYIKQELNNYSITDNFSVVVEKHYCDVINSMSLKLPKIVYLNPTNKLKINYQSIIMTNNEEMDGDNIFHYNGEFSHIMNEDSLAMREKIFSTIKNFIN